MEFKYAGHFAPHSAGATKVPFIYVATGSAFASTDLSCSNLRKALAADPHPMVGVLLQVHHLWP